MQMCSICHKNIATIYTAKLENGKQEIIGLCLQCAKKMGYPMMDQILNETGMSPEEFENISQQMNNMLENVNIEEAMEGVKELQESGALGDGGDEGDEKSLSSFFNSIFSNASAVKKPLDNEEGKMEGAPAAGETKIKNKRVRKKRKNLENYGINLTRKAKEGGVDKVIGRNREIDRVVQILNRRTKNNPVLIGEPGVGKTAIAEGLAVRIVEKEIPEKLFNAEVYLLDLTSVVAGTQFRGQFEARMKSIIEEAKENGNIILVIDEIHNIIGAGEAQGGAINAANILKPALARGEIQVLGATTLEEYRKNIEKDSALERRFQPVLVEEPSVKDTIEIIKGIKHYYEDYHKVKISGEVIEAATNLAQRYINDRFLPDKAIDVIDEASSRANLKNKGLVEIKALKDEEYELEKIMEEAADKNDYEKAADYKVKLCKVKEKINCMEKECSHIELTLEDVAFIIESWTKIPVMKVTEEEGDKLLNLEMTLHKRIVGQEKAVAALAKAIRRNRLGFSKKKKPSSFIFVGPTGVGKTQLVKTLADELFGSEDSLIRIDMSEYMEKHTASKLIGAPPGYVGYDEGGQLTEKVRRKPYSVILLDEIEKAHPDVFNMLLQILEDGRLTDSQGRTINFENTVIIMTSNAGTNFKSSGIGFANESYQVVENKVRDALKETFKPEFLNRVDEIIIFSSLTKDELYEILDLMLKEVIGEMEEKGVNVHVSKDVKEFILQKGYDPKYGARPLRRAIQKYIEDEIVEEYLQNRFKKGDTIKVILEQGEVKIK
ncbi:ATP-dependent Clp protease ATP-binding subunit [Haloimpatiens massiliensis]|uniref:ATP-dependent Clp protease ATP-binding subunit n=1 Tax=Haloimpatiens massiliensis TaxID=1658110 RepID=UPI000C81B283|nr:ATP-dependent Clp protease ATP-binding subunit [Haloimpatiens massiliensis]